MNIIHKWPKCSHNCPIQEVIEKIIKLIQNMIAEPDNLTYLKEATFGWCIKYICKKDEVKSSNEEIERIREVLGMTTTTEKFDDIIDQEFVDRQMKNFKMKLKMIYESKIEEQKKAIEIEKQEIIQQHKIEIQQLLQQKEQLELIIQELEKIPPHIRKIPN